MTEDPTSEHTPAESPSPESTPPPAIELDVQAVVSTLINEEEIYSSSKLDLTWSTTGVVAHHHTIQVSESIGNTAKSLSVAACTSELRLTRLKSQTPYSITVRACLDADCTDSISSEPVVISTATETWQIIGSGNSFSTATKLDPLANTMPYAFRYGDWSTQAGHLKLYFSGYQADYDGALPAISEEIPQQGDTASAMTFLPKTGYGLHRTNEMRISTFQAVPFAGKIRLFFEATDIENDARIHFIDSQDGWTGNDFNSTSSTVCDTGNYTDDGGCSSQTILWLEGDANGNPNVVGFYQFKIGYPMMESAMWDGAPGTFMVVTTELAGGICSPYFFNAGYAVWDGEDWNLQYDEDCPILWGGVQAPMPVHVEEDRYRLYFSANQTPYQSEPDFEHKPVRLLYGDGSLTGDAIDVDFEDWEDKALARTPVFLWPNGSPLTEGEISFLDDYQILFPTGDLDFAMMYSNMTYAQKAFVGALLLLNP